MNGVPGVMAFESQASLSFTSELNVWPIAGEEGSQRDERTVLVVLYPRRLPVLLGELFLFLQLLARL